MVVTAKAQPERNEAVAVSPMTQDKRRFRRILMAIDGRFLDGSSEEHTMVTQDISCAGAHLISTHRPSIGDTVVLYLDELGRVAGKVVRHTEHGFGVVFEVTSRKRDKIVDRLTWLWNRDDLQLEDDRSMSRYTAGGAALITLSDGRSIQCHVLDISATGAGLEAMTQAPLVGDIVIIGTLKAEVMRSEGRQFGIRFLGRVDVSNDL
ncbi:MAG: PilZ domain-containing protein [Pseudomonadota bacterium]